MPLFTATRSNSRLVCRFKIIGVIVLRAEHAEGPLPNRCQRLVAIVSAMDAIAVALGLVGIQDSHPYLIVIQASDGAIRFD
jgi:hypothetical protein